MLPSFEQVHALISEGVLNEVAGDGGTKFTLAASIVHQRGLPVPAIVVDTKTERLWLHDDCWLAPQSCHGMVVNPVTEVILEAMYPDRGARQGALDELWARQCASTWPGVDDGRFAVGSISEVSNRVQNILRLGAVSAGPAARHNVFGGQDVRFFGGDNWDTVARDLAAVPQDERIGLIFDLFGRALLDYILESRFHAASFHTRNTIRLIRFGRCGLGPHLSNPMLILDRPEAEGLIGAVPDEVVDNFVRNYEQVVDAALAASRIFVPTDAVMRTIFDFEAGEFFPGLDTAGPLSRDLVAHFVWRHVEKTEANSQYE